MSSYLERNVVRAVAMAAVLVAAPAVAAEPAPSQPQPATSAQGTSGAQGTPAPYARPQVEQWPPPWSPSGQAPSQSSSRHAGARPSSSDPSAVESRRDSWYIGFGLGYGRGKASGGGDWGNYDDVTGEPPDVRVALQLEVGVTLSPTFLLGLDVTALREQATRSVYGYDVTWALQANNYDAVVTWFPRGEGPFLRGGAGLSVFQNTISGDGDSVDESATGVNVLAGLGYAFWLGRHFNLTANVDVSRQWYGDASASGEMFRPDGSWFWSSYLGFVWY